MDVLEAIRTRRSVRDFAPEPIDRGDLETILDAGRHAPSAGNGQPWRFLVVSEPASRTRLRRVLEETAHRRIDRLSPAPEDAETRKVGARDFLGRITGAPVLVFVFVDSADHPDLVPYDGALAAQNMMLAAHALGYGTSFQTTYFPETAVRSHFGVPARFKLVCVLPLGRPAGSPRFPGRIDLDSLVWMERVPKETTCAPSEEEGVG